jgi:hypothetical protein
MKGENVKITTSHSLVATTPLAMPRPPAELLSGRQSDLLIAATRPNSGRKTAAVLV